MTTFNDLPPYSARNLQRIHGGLFGDLMASVVRAIGPIESDEAEKIVGAVLGPLRLVPPPPDRTTQLCDHSYFSVEGEWHLCDKNHDNPDDCGDPTHHCSAAGEGWYDDEGAPRAFVLTPEEG